jgi:hypothetical protein
MCLDQFLVAKQNWCLVLDPSSLYLDWTMCIWINLSYLHKGVLGTNYYKQITLIIVITNSTLWSPVRKMIIKFCSAPCPPAQGRKLILEVPIEIFQAPSKSCSVHTCPIWGGDTEITLLASLWVTIISFWMLLKIQMIPSPSLEMCSLS